MKFVEYKQELSVFCHFSCFSVSSFGDSTHVKVMINLFETMDRIILCQLTHKYSL